MKKPKSKKWVAILGVPVSLLVMTLTVVAMAFLASASGGWAEGTADGGAEPVKAVEGPRCGMFKEGISTKKAASMLTEAGVKNVRLHSRDASMTVLAGDSLPCLFIFGKSGFEDEINLRESLSAVSRPEKYAVGVMKNRHIFVTAEDFTFTTEGGEPVLGIFMISRGVGKLNTYKIDVSKAAEVYGGYIEPMLIEKPESNQVILHAKDSDGNDWPRAYIFDGATGKLKGEVDWNKAINPIK